MKRTKTMTLGWATLAAALAASPAAEAADTLAVVGGDVHTVSGAMLPGATVLVVDGKIQSVGRDVAIPTGATVINARGKVVTPGLIDVSTQLGLVEISLESSTVDGQPSLKDPIRAAVYAGDAIDPLSTLVAVARRHGVTSVVSQPSGGLVSGRSAWVDLVGPESRHLFEATSGPVALHVRLGEGGAGAYGGSRSAAFMRLREAFDDARAYRARKSAYERNALYDMPTSRLDLEAMQPALLRRVPVVVEVSRAADIRAVLALAESERIDVVLVGAEEGWLVAEALAEAKVPVVVDPLADLPSSFEARHARADNVLLLAQAGVPVVVSTRSSHNVNTLRFRLANAVRSGLPRELALRAGTLNAAEAMGRADDYGSLDRGKVANLVVWTGDPFSPASYAESVVVRGEVQPVESRQTALAERYIERLGLRKAPRK